MTKSKVPPIPDPAQHPLHNALDAGLGNLALRELLEALLAAAARAERQAFLHAHPDDKGNGSWSRSLQVGSLPLSIPVPRTRSGRFRPSILPEPWQRAFPEDRQHLLLGLLASSRSINAAKSGLRQLGLSASEDDLERIATAFVDELRLRNSRPLDTDLIALFLDAKYVEVRDDQRLRPWTIHVVVGLRRDGRKRVLLAEPRPGRENLQEWKRALRGLLERGLRRVLLVVQDDFPGLLPVCKSLFPGADLQLCIVHMQRNATSHLDRERAREFQQRVRTIKAAWDAQLGAAQFEELCRSFENDAPAFVANLRQKRDHYLAFLDYPPEIRRSLSTTNAVEAMDGQLERFRRTGWLLPLTGNPRDESRDDHTRPRKPPLVVVPAT